MTTDLFAGIPVRDYNAAVAWYELLFGAAPFRPDDTEAVWEVAEHRYVFIEVRPEHAGHAMHTLFVDDFDARISEIAGRGLEPAKPETYANGVRKAIFRDPDGMRSDSVVRRPDGDRTISAGPYRSADGRSRLG